MRRVFRRIAYKNMKRKRATILICCTISACLIIGLLHLLSAKMIPDNNHFVRKLPSHQIVGLGFIKLSNDGWYFAGMDSKYIWLANRQSRQKTLRVDYKKKDTTLFQIKLSDTLRFSKAAVVQKDTNVFCIADGLKGAVYIGDDGTHWIKTKQLPMFTTDVFLAKNSFILKLYKPNGKVALVKTGVKGVLAEYTLKGQQNENLFSTDGALIKDQKSNRIFYSYYYRNEFVCLDSNLHILYKAKSIDTVSRSHLLVARIKDRHEITLAEPPRFVKEQIAANDKYLFVHSVLKADNETEQTFQLLNAIDVYDSHSGKYVQTIYIMNFNQEKMKEFAVYGQYLVALYSHYLYIHKLMFN